MSQSRISLESCQACQREWSNEFYVDSGQSLLQKIQFATSIISPLACSSVLAFSKDVYILELGADVQLMGAVGTAIAIWGPACFPIAGYLMDKNLLGRCFSWDKWGRRAPWFLTHLVVVAVATALMYLPPSLDSGVLCWWFLLCGSVQAWTLAVLFTAFASTRIEIYPTKEERSEVEAFVKVGAGIGNTLGIVPQLIIAAGSTWQARSGASASLAFAGIISIISLPILRTAKQDFDPTKVQSPHREFISLLKIPTYLHYLAVRFLESFATTLVLSGMLYYLTLVEGFSGDTRTRYVLAIGALIAVVTLAVMIPWTQFFRFRRSSINTNAVSGSVCAVGVVAPIALFLGDSFLPRPIGLILYACVEQATWTGQTYWRLIALGWLVDEDSLATAHRRREAVFAAGVSLITSIGAGCAMACLVLGLGFAGLNMDNCEQLCNNVADSLQSDCVTSCQKSNIERQPIEVKIYLRGIFGVLVPLLQLMAAVLTYIFPIKGNRLDAIYAGQEDAYRPTITGATEMTVKVISDTSGQSSAGQPPNSPNRLPTSPRRQFGSPRRYAGSPRLPPKSPRSPWQHPGSPHFLRYGGAAPAAPSSPAAGGSSPVPLASVPATRIPSSLGMSPENSLTQEDSQRPAEAAPNPGASLTATLSISSVPLER